jgi:hypothetical protein
MSAMSIKAGERGRRSRAPMVRDVAVPETQPRRTDQSASRSDRRVADRHSIRESSVASEARRFRRGRRSSPTASPSVEAAGHLVPARQRNSQEFPRQTHSDRARVQKSSAASFGLDKQSVAAECMPSRERHPSRNVMPLEMREHCEKCHVALPLEAAACICSYECTFCPACSSAMATTCPNCGGELVARPRRRPKR